jgi:large subunit ribosomal protein L25
MLFKLRVRALPKALPEQIVVDVSHLEIGKSVHVGDIKAPEGVQILGHAETVVFAVAAPKAEEVVEAAAEAKPAGEVEMTKEKKTDAAAGDKKPEPAAEKKAEKK